VSRARAIAVALVALAGCAGAEADREPVPMCGPLASLPPLAEACATGELDEFAAALSERAIGRASQALVRVELGDDARVRAVCVEPGPGYSPSRARHALAAQLDELRVLPAGPACAAGRRIDLNRYEAAWAELHDREIRCEEQVRTTRQTQGLALGRGDTRELRRLLEFDADWIRLDAPGTTRPVIFVKPEVPNPAVRRADEVVSYCSRKSKRYEKRAACIESEGWERLEPPPR